jgi:hypothetical protein
MQHERINSMKRIKKVILDSSDGFNFPDSPFEIVGYSMTDNMLSEGVEAVVKLKSLSDGSGLHEAADGDGPVDAFYKAMQKALMKGGFSQVEGLKLTDYSVVSTEEGADARVKATITFSYKGEEWVVACYSTNVIKASVKPVVFSFHYILSDKK